MQEAPPRPAEVAAKPQSEASTEVALASPSHAVHAGRYPAGAKLSMELLTAGAANLPVDLVVVPLP